MKRRIPEDLQRHLGEEFPLALAVGVIAAIGFAIMTGQVLLGALAGGGGGLLVLGLIVGIYYWHRADSV